MPSPLMHAASGYLLYRYAKDNLPDVRVWFYRIPYLLLVVVTFSLLPDVDAVPGLLTGDLERFHNQFTHSLITGAIAALIFSVLTSKIFKLPRRSLFLSAFISYGLHVVMDFFTGGRGVMLFWPLSQTRFSSPVQLLYGLHWGDGWISPLHLWTLFTEVLTFLVLLLIAELLRKVLHRTAISRNSTDQATGD